LDAEKVTNPKPTGPEKPTLIEKLLNILPGNYFLKCLIFWIIFGTPGMLLTRYLDTFDFNQAVALFAQFAPQNIIVFSIPNFAMPLYAFYGIGYMRKSIVRAMPEMESVTANGKSTLNTIFKPVSRLAPPLILAVLFAVISIISFPGQTQHIAGIFSLIIKIGGFTFSALGYGTFIWAYSSSISGLHQLGKHHLHFVSFYEDSHMGMKPLGSVALSLAWVYFFGFGLVFFSANPVPVPLLLVSLGLILLGIAFFFLPLRIVHEKMKKEKHVAEKLLRKNLSQIVASLDSKSESSNEITDILAFQMLEQKVSKISEWPFDTITLSWFSAIIITVLGTIITRYLLIFLGL
jgi:hypothetical protein